jgi:serine/threonine protein phosphatase 1
MLAWPFSPRTPHHETRFTENRVGYAIGDIHGREDLLIQLIEQLERRAGEDVRVGQKPLVVFLGDYVDRGPNSRGVLELLASGRPHGFERIFLKGNHEQAMLAFMSEPVANRFWMLHGGLETLRSYGVQPPSAMGADEQALLDAAAGLSAALPDSHRAFLETLERYSTAGGYLFVHAGVDVSKALEQQSDTDLFWSRERFLKAKKRFAYRVVHGHTPVSKPVADQRRVSIDTGAYATGALTAARFEGADVSFIGVRAGG